MKVKTQKRRPDEYSFRRNINGYLLIAPAVLAILLLSVYPLLQGIWISFLNYDMTRQILRILAHFAGIKKLLGWYLQIRSIEMQWLIPFYGH